MKPFVMDDNGSYCLAESGRLFMPADEAIMSDMLQRQTQYEGTETVVVNRVTALEAWRNAKAAYLGRVTATTTGLSVDVLGVSVASTGLITRVAEVVNFINNKICPALEQRGITATA